MNRLPDAPVCERESDLISFLYGEIDERAAQTFEQHLMSCVECESQLSAFKQVRSAVVSWRQEALGGARAESVPVSTAVARASDHSKHSALTAIRQFFDLSPLWMKGAIAFASVVFCVVSVLALSHLVENPTPLDAGNEKIYSAQDLKEKIEDALRSDQLAREAQKAIPPPSTAPDNNQQDKVERRVTNQSRDRFAANPKVRRGPLTKSEREQLAADLRLIVPQDDTDLELLSDGNNQ